MPRVKHDPTPEEIREACQRIQETWTAEEEHKRRTGKAIADQSWTAPEVVVESEAE